MSSSATLLAFKQYAATQQRTLALGVAAAGWQAGGPVAPTAVLCTAHQQCCSCRCCRCCCHAPCCLHELLCREAELAGLVPQQLPQAALQRRREARHALRQPGLQQLPQHSQRASCKHKHAPQSMFELCALRTGAQDVASGRLRMCDRLQCCHCCRRVLGGLRTAACCCCCCCSLPEYMQHSQQPLPHLSCPQAQSLPRLQHATHPWVQASSPGAPKAFCSFTAPGPPARLAGRPLLHSLQLFHSSRNKQTRADTSLLTVCCDEALVANGRQTIAVVKHNETHTSLL